MAIKIDKKIVKYGLKKDPSDQNDNGVRDDGSGDITRPTSNVIQMHERLERPEMLLGTTYKIKTPLSDHALYVTINDIVLNHGTEHEQRRPFEIFINSKNMEHFQWIVALTRIISAVFRKGGDVTFLVEELHSVFDPKGGYFKRGGKYMPSLVAEIGDAIESHLIHIGLLKREGIDEHQQKIIDEKRREFEERFEPADEPSSDEAGEAAGMSFGEAGVDAGDAEVPMHSGDEPENTGFPAGAKLCEKCHVKATIMMDGCMTCLNCGNSKCG